MNSFISALLYLAFTALGLFIAAKSFSYCLMIFFHKDAHWMVDVIAGAILSEICVPVAIVVWLLKQTGVI